MDDSLFADGLSIGTFECKFPSDFPSMDLGTGLFGMDEPLGLDFESIVSQREKKDQSVDIKASQQLLQPSYPSPLQNRTK